MSVGIYIAYPIDQFGKPSSVDKVVEHLKTDSLVSWVFDPGAAFSTGGGARTPAIREINAKAIDEASIVVAWMPKNAVSIGVPMEIDRAVRAGKKVIVVSDAPSWMLTFTEPNVEVVRFMDMSAYSVIDAAVYEVYHSPSVASPAPQEDLPVALGPGGILPSRGYPDDAGLDLYVSEAVEIPPGEFRDVECSIRVQLPEWSWGLVTGRSSTLRNKGLMMYPGVIDAGYRGPLFTGVWNLTKEPVKIEAGDRIAQLIILDNSTRKVNPVEVTELGPGSRGTNGFGSTGN